MKMGACSISGRKGWKLENDRLSLSVMSGGGHLAELKLKGIKAPSPFWAPAWKTIEPWQYKKADSPKYGCKLLASIYGHNLCLGAFGDPSPEEAKAGLEPHGEAPVSRWRCLSKKLSAKRLAFEYGCHLAAARMKFSRAISMEAGSSIVRIKEKITSTARTDTPFTMCQHVTFGPPFVERGVTLFDMSGARGRAFPGEFSKLQRLKAGASFKWPAAPGARGEVDLRFMGKGKNSDFASIEMNRKIEHAWFSATNPRQGLLVAYIWRRSDYPWTGIWEESFARGKKPWDGQSLTRGMEFSNTPFPIGLRQAVNLGSFMGQPAFRWLPAKSSLTFEYSILAIPVEKDCEGVASIRPEGKGFIVNLI